VIAAEFSLLLGREEGRLASLGNVLDFESLVFFRVRDELGDSRLSG